MKISHGAADHVIHDVLQYWKVSTELVLKQFTSDPNERHDDVCEATIGCFESEGDGLLGLNPVLYD